MTCSVTLDARQRQALLDRYRKDPDPEVRFRAHILLLLADGHSWSIVATFLFCSSRTIDRWVKRFHQEGVEAVAGHKPGRPCRFGAAWVAVVINLVSSKVPRNFGFLRSRWCCEVVALLMLRCYRLDVSRETIRRWLHQGGMVDRRPRPTVKPDEQERRVKLAELRQLVAGLPENETAVFQDEVDINTNPKIGSMWMFKGQQAKVETPGTNQKRYLAGSIHWRSGQVFLTEGKPKQGRNGFVPGPLGRLAPSAATVQEDPRHLRQCEVSQQRGGDGLPVGSSGPNRAALFAAPQPGLQPDRTGVVALA